MPYCFKILRSSNSKMMAFLFFAIIMFSLPGLELMAQDVQCSTNPIGPLVTLCSPNGARCQVSGAPGTCKSKVKYEGLIKYTNCFCEVSLPGIILDYVWDDGKWELVSSIRSAAGTIFKRENLSEGDVIRYDIEDNVNNASARWINDQVGETDGHEVHVGDGYFELTIIDMKDPQHVKVSLTDVAYKVPAIEMEGVSLGETHYKLSPNGNHNLIWDREKGTLKNEENSHVDLVASNDLWSNLPVSMFFDGLLSEDGSGLSLYWKQFRQIPREGNKTAWGTDIVGPMASDMLMEVFPNPTNGLTHIKVGNTDAATYNIQVFDAMGRVAFQKDLAASNIIDLDMQQLSGGLYHIMVTAGHETSTQPVIISK